MERNPLKRKWQAGRHTVNGWLSIPSSVSAEIMARLGWDSLTIDMQHGLIDYAQALGMLQAISSTPTPALVRVPWLEPGIIMKMLDAGAWGIICPMVERPEDAAELVRCCRYPPSGRRSFGPTRAALLWGTDYASWANRELLAIAMIETREAVDRLDGILATEGLDAVYVGPADLSSSLGFTPGFDPEQPEVRDAIARIVDGARRHGLRAGIHCGSTAYARRMLELGFDFVSLLSDARLLTLKGRELLGEMTTAGKGTGHSTGGAHD